MEVEGSALLNSLIELGLGILSRVIVQYPDDM